MRDHEIELISALVEGALEDESEARALIASSPELQAEYEAQLVAHRALSSAGSAVMRDDEKAALHRDVWATLRTETATRSAPTPWYWRLVPVGVGIFVVGIGAATLLNQGGSDQGEALFDAAESTATTAAATETLEGSDAQADGGASTETTEAEALAPSAAVEFSAAARSLREGAEATGELSTDEETTRSHEDCLVDAGLEGYTTVSRLEELLFDQPKEDGQPTGPFIAAIPSDGEVETAPITFVDLTTCDVVYVDD